MQVLYMRWGTKLAAQENRRLVIKKKKYNKKLNK